MGLLDALLGRTKPVPPNLDALFAVPSAAITLQAATDFMPTGTGSVCFRAAEGRAFSDIEKDVTSLLSMGQNKTAVEVTADSYGFTWLVCRHTPDDIEGLVTDLHAVNSTLEAGGFGPQLLCTIVAFRDSSARRLGLVYLYKRGTFYPFAPAGGPGGRFPGSAAGGPGGPPGSAQGGERRDNAAELQVRGVLTNDLKIETDLARWFPVWGAPGL